MCPRVPVAVSVRGSSLGRGDCDAGIESLAERHVRGVHRDSSCRAQNAGYILEKSDQHGSMVYMCFCHDQSWCKNAKESVFAGYPWIPMK